MRRMPLMTAALSLGLFACSSPEPANEAAPSVALASDTGTPDAPPAERVACAQGDVPLTDDCTIERGIDGTMTIRHPDGAFRRLNADGTAADGAETAIVTSVEGARDVTVAGDHYRLPQPPAEPPQ